MADTLKDDMLSLVDDLAGLPGELGFRPQTVDVRVVTWSGSTVGEGVQVVTETRLTVGNGQNPKVREVHRHDVTTSSDQIEARYDIGPLTPEFPGGGTSETILRPESYEPNVEVFYVISGKGMPDSGLLCKRVSDQMDRPLRNKVRVQSTGQPA